MPIRPVLGPQRFSREGFKQLPELKTTKMGNPNDATIDIPLTTVTSKTGARNANDPHSLFSPQTSNEKRRLFDRQTAGRRKVSDRKEANHGREDMEEDTLTQMGKIYDKILNFSLITRYFLYVLPIALLIAVPIVIGAAAAKNARMGGVRIVWIFTWVEVVWLGLWISKIFAKWLPSIFQFLCGIVSSGTRKYAAVLEALEIPLSLSGWALVSLATFKPLMTRNPDKPPSVGDTHWQDILQRILAAFLIASLIFLGEKLLMQLLSISYHRKQFSGKIMESKHNVYLVSLLYDASRTLFPAYCNEFAEEDYIINDSMDLSIGGSTVGSQHGPSGSATPFRILQNVGRFGDKLTSAFGNIAHEVTGKQVFNPNSAHSIVVEALEKNKSSEALAKRIWMSFVVEGKDALYQEDIIEVLGSDRQGEAEECFACLDRDGNGDVSLDEMIMTVCDFGRMRTSIASSLHDVAQAIDVLDNLLCTIVFIITIFIFVAFLNASFTTTLATAGTALLSLSFVFATTAQEVLGSCIFLFVKHPYDVGDRVDIGEEQLVVEHISLLFTVFKKIKNHKTTQVPNIVLNSNWIENVSRSKAMREQLLMYINFDTSIEDIQLLKNEMQAFVLDRENCRDFQPDIDVEVTGISEMNKMELKVEIKHKSNWSNEAVRAARRSKFMCALVLALRKVPIYAPGGGDAALGSNDKPTYSVSVSDAEAKVARDAFAQTKEAKRLVPSKKPTEDSSATGASTGSNMPNQTSGSDLRSRSATLTNNPPAAETNAMSTLNTRPPASDPAHDWVNDVGSQNAPQDAQRRRSNDIEEVRGMLHRTSTRGKRKQTMEQFPKPPSSNFPTIREPVTPVSQYHDRAPSIPELGLQPGISLPVQGTNGGYGGNINTYQSSQTSQYPAAGPTAQQQPYGVQQQQQARRVPPGGNAFAQVAERGPDAVGRKNSFAQGR